MEDFEDFIVSLELQHFAPSEFLVGLDRGNSLPPRELWPNIALTAKIVDRVRSHFRRSVTITSAYRSPSYNRSVGGATRSQHPAFGALDFKVKGVSSSMVSAILGSWRDSLFQLPVTVSRFPFVSDAGAVPFKTIETWERRGDDASYMRFAGGIGRYKTFTHLDTRGINSTWNG